MITSNYQVDGDIFSYADKFWCSSSDEKPTNEDAKEGLINGATLEEVDTGKEFVFDKAENKWTEKKSGESGGGSSPIALRVSYVYDEETETENLSETWQTIYDAIAAGLLVFITGVYDEPGYLRSVNSGLIRSAYYEYQAGTYKVTVDGLAGGQLATYECEAASANDYPVVL